MLRHTVATLAYRGGKVVSNAPQGFANFRIAPSSRTAGQILAHVGDLLDWAFCLAKGKHEWHDSKPLEWEQDVDRFFHGLKLFDDYLASTLPLGFSEEQLFQGPVADALTHIGQIAMLRRAAEAPVKGENYFKAEILTGRVGPDQSTRRVEFD